MATLSMLTPTFEALAALPVQVADEPVVLESIVDGKSVDDNEELIDIVPSPFVVFTIPLSIVCNLVAEAAFPVQDPDEPVVFWLNVGNMFVVSNVLSVIVWLPDVPTTSPLGAVRRAILPKPKLDLAPLWVVAPVPPSDIGTVPAVIDCPDMDK